jgi:putative transposase
MAMKKKRVTTNLRRRVTVRLYPKAKQMDRLQQLAYLQCQLYNAAVAERIDAWRKQKKSIGFVAQCASLKVIRQSDPEYAAVNQTSMIGTLRRVELAFAAFFRRVAENKQLPLAKRQPVGFPRFKATCRFKGWQYSRHGNGHRVHFADGEDKGLPIWRHGHIYLQGVGKLRFRGISHFTGEIRHATITRKCNAWYASVVVEGKPQRDRGEGAVGLDWGVKTFASTVNDLGETGTEPNERLFWKHQDKVIDDLKAQSKALRRKSRSKRTKRRHLRIGRAYRKLGNQRKDRAHKLSSKLVRRYGAIFTEEIKAKNITRRVKGTVEKPGVNVAAKSGLNRSILDTAPGMLNAMLKYKAEEAGTELVFLDTRRWKPSQTCPKCWAVKKKTLAERHHRCPCGFEADRDHSAALVMLLVGLASRGSGRTSGRLAPGNPILSGEAARVG